MSLKAILKYDIFCFAFKFRSSRFLISQKRVKLFLTLENIVT